MTTNRSGWRAAASTLRTRPALLAAAVLAAAAVGTGSIASVLAGTGEPASVTADPSSTPGGALTAPVVGDGQADAAAPATDGTPSDPAPAAAAPEAASVEHAFQLQTTYYYCGPAAARVALSAQGKVFSQDRLAGMLGTTTAGTPSAFDLTRVLNEQLGNDRYRTVELSQRQVTEAQIAQLKTDVVSTLSRGETLVINIIGTGTDVDGDAHAYPVGHYINVVGYVNKGETVSIADSADPDKPHYDVNVAELARWAGSRGYSAAAG